MAPTTHRTGSEPVQARSPLRLRLGLALCGVVWGAAAAVGFALTGHPGFAAAVAAIGALALADAVVVVRHIRQGAHYQPGRSIPPYRPVERDDPRHYGRRTYGRR
jgi:hypothetical protein